MFVNTPVGRKLPVAQSVLLSPFAVLRSAAMPSFGTLALGACCCVAIVACASSDRPPGIESGLSDAGAGPDGAVVFDAPTGDAPPPPPDASGYCGNQFFQVVQEPPNLYFVIDRSGSMTALAKPPSGTTKYTAVRSACVNLVRQLGSRASFGAAVFPGYPYVDECSAGIQVFPTQRGDAPDSLDGGTGPVTTAFAVATNVVPVGGTPIAATLTTLLPILSALAGKTAVVLATDGGPNCNAVTPCDTQDCIWNIEQDTLPSGLVCTAATNCCSPLLANGPGNRGCLDTSPTVAAVQKLRDAGIRTYVVGIPGSGLYTDLLDQLAVVGGTARAQTPRYYRVDDISMLQGTLSQIGDKALITCQFQLDQPPPEPNLVNVYLDATVVPYDEQNGWSWTSDTQLELHGRACDKLESGEVAQVQVVAGCPTQQPR